MSGEFETTVDVRYADVDTYGHVNNAVYATFLEEARIDYLDAVLGDDARSLTADGDGENADGIVVASVELDFRHSVGMADELTVAVEIPRLGDSSFPIEYEIRTGDGVAAVGETTMVAFDREAGTSQPIPDAWREKISAFEGL